MARTARHAEAPAGRARRGGPERILAAAFTCFSRYGFKRVSLEQVAAETGISRAALYLHFRNKEDLFRALARQLLEGAQAEAEEAAEARAPLAARLEAILAAKYARVYERVHGSPHAAEILDENSRQCGDLMEDFRRRFLRLLRDVLAAADARGEIRLRAAGLEAPEAAELLADAAKGLERPGPGGPARFRRRLSRLVGVFVQGMGGRAAAARAARPARRRPTRVSS
jgi:AcrR family transcriptional regulator